MVFLLRLMERKIGEKSFIKRTDESLRARECASHDPHLVKNTEKKKKSTPIMYRNASQKFQQHLSLIHI